MMVREKVRRRIGLKLLSAMSAVLLGAAAAHAGGIKYEVTVTNLTRGQIMSPAVVAVHTDKLDPLFALGAPASSELAAVAEDAVSGPLVAALSGDSEVKDVQTIFGAGGPILPGESASVVLEAGGKFRNVSLVGMLVTTNDGFFALNGVRGPSHGTAVHTAPAYDAGSEANNEDCGFIPGPPCGSPGVRATAGAEGYVHIHAGIHGTGDLNTSEHDWRNPVAKVTIRRVK